MVARRWSGCRKFTCSRLAILPLCVSVPLRFMETLSFAKPLVSKEFSRNLEIALFVRVRHSRTIHPLPGPLDRSGQINGIFDGAGIDQALAIRTQPEALRQTFLSAARQRGRETHRMFFEIGGFNDESVSFPSADG